MVFQEPAGYAVFGREIKVPQTFIPRVMRGIVFGKSQYLTDMLNVIHVIIPSGTVGLSDCQVFANVLHAWVLSDYINIFNTSITYTGVHVRSMEGLTVPQHSIADGVTTGVLSADPLPTYVSLPVLLRTGTTGHGGHGMWHVFPPSEGENTSVSDPLSTYITDVSVAMSNLMGALFTADLTPVVASFKYITVKPITSLATRNYWGTVNSRKIGHGR